MGLLDELKAKADQVLSQEPVEGADGQPQEADELRRLRSRLKALFCYLQEMTKHLKVVPLDVSVAYSLPGDFTTPKMPLRNFAVTADASDRMSEIRLRCDAVAERPAFIPASNEKMAAEIAEGLKKYGLTYAKRTSARSGHKAACIYEVGPRIPINYVFRIDAEKEGLHLILRNYGELGIRKDFFVLAELTDDWLENVGALVIHKDTRLLDHAPPDAERERIRNRLTNARMEEIDEQIAEAEAVRRRKPRSAWEILFRSGKEPPEK